VDVPVPTREPTGALSNFSSLHDMLHEHVMAKLREEIKTTVGVGEKREIQIGTT
jgi:hypothetical protein